jgi:multidrug transporter EmrE-like cation transporter
MTIFNVAMMSAAEIFGNVHFQNYSSNNKVRSLVLGFLGYLGVIYFLIKSFGHGNMLWVSAMWEGMIIILGSTVAYFYLGERFDHPIQYFGIFLGLMSLICVEYGKHLSLR